MSWNKPSSVPQPPPKKSAPPVLLHGLLAGLIVVALGALCYFMFRPSAATPKRDSAKDRGLIKEVAPAIPQKAPEPEPEPEKVEPKIVVTTPEHPEPWIRVIHKHGEEHVITQSWDVIKPNASWVNKIAGQPRKLYKTQAENYVAALAQMPPGTTCLEVDLGPDFDKEFIARIADPVGYEKDDTDEERAVREEVHAFKQEAARLIGEGKTPTEIVCEARKNLNRVAQMRGNLAVQITEMRESGVPEPDIELAVEAANKILEKNGGLLLQYKISRSREGRRKVMQRKGQQQ